MILEFINKNISFPKCLRICSSCSLFLERTYLCLGQWEEKDVMYTYTLRNDTNTNECFVGVIVNDEEIYIKEAGDHCTRNIDPRTQGMRLYKKGKYEKQDFYYSYRSRYLIVNL